MVKGLIETGFSIKCKMGERKREVVNTLIKLITKCDMGEHMWEIFNWMIEIMIKSEMGKVRKVQLVYLFEFVVVPQSEMSEGRRKRLLKEIKEVALKLKLFDWTVRKHTLRIEEIWF